MSSEGENFVTVCKACKRLNERSHGNTGQFDRIVDVRSNCKIGRTRDEPHLASDEYGKHYARSVGILSWLSC